jgi:hypothetical protein
MLFNKQTVMDRNVMYGFCHIHFTSLHFTSLHFTSLQLSFNDLIIFTSLHWNFFFNDIHPNFTWPYLSLS